MQRGDHRREDGEPAGYPSAELQRAGSHADGKQLLGFGDVHLRRVHRQDPRHEPDVRRAGGGVLRPRLRDADHGDVPSDGSQSDAERLVSGVLQGRLDVRERSGAEHRRQLHHVL